MFTPIAANTIAKLSSESSNTAFPGNLTRPACLQIWAAIYQINKIVYNFSEVQGHYHHVLKKFTSLCGKPAAEKMGIFCPLAIEFMISIAEIPV